MQPCAYCDTLCQPTREHVVPRWYNDTPGDNETFSARAPLTHVKGDLIVKDVCQSCNGGPLASLDGYGKELYDRYFAIPVYGGETVNFEYDGERLLRWLLKISYNSARAQNADILVLREYRKAMLGVSPISGRIRCWLHLVSATWFDPQTDLIRPANRIEKHHPNIEEPLWFRIGQFRLQSHPAQFLVQRTVLLNSFGFTLLIGRTDVVWPNEEFDQWTRVFASTYPHAKPITADGGSVILTPGDDHAVTSIAPLYLDYPSRFSEEVNPFIAQALMSVKEGAPIVVLYVPHELIEMGDITLISPALHMMVSTRENVSAFKQRVGVMVDGFDDDPRGLWQFPKVREFFRRLFIECPFVMLVAHPDGGLLKLLAACWVYEDPLTEEGERKRMNEFLTRAFDGLNGLHHTIMLSEEQNREICTSAARVLFGDTPPF